jgi:hypothetical protein
MVAALELIRRKPDTVLKMADSISAQTNKIIGEILRFSLEFENTLGITRDTATTFLKNPADNEPR